MQANELRIGNQIMPNGIMVIVDHQTFYDLMRYSEQYQPIPLTEEWLLKFGFEQGGYDFLFWYKDGCEFAGINWADADEPEYQFLNFRVDKDRVIQIHHVHHLQNLWHSLSGQELTIKE